MNRFQTLGHIPYDAQPMTVGIRDVAALAGVGVGTVSRVINDAPGVRAETRERVRGAIDDLGYRPDPRARALSLGRSQSVSAVVPFFTHPSAVARLRGVVEALRDSAYDLVLCDVETTAARERSFSSLAAAERAAAVMLVSLPPTDAEVAHYAAAAKPVILVDCEHPALSSVVVDDEAGGRIAAEHLVGLGHDRLAFIGEGPDPAGRFKSSSRRRSGFEAALARAGPSNPPERIVELDEHSQSAARAATQALLARGDRPTAIFAAADTLALGVLEAAAAAGIDVPAELSVMGFDDLEVAAHVGLTTVRQPLHETGRVGGERILAALRGEPPPAGRTVLPLRIVVRRTTGRVPAHV